MILLLPLSALEKSDPPRRTRSAAAAVGGAAAALALVLLLLVLYVGRTNAQELDAPVGPQLHAALAQAFGKAAAAAAAASNPGASDPAAATRPPPISTLQEAARGSALEWGPQSDEVVKEMSGRLDDTKAQLDAALDKAGLPPARRAALTRRLGSRVAGALGALDAVRSAYEGALRAKLGGLLDGGRRLRGAPLDGGALAEEIRAARGAECSPASFVGPREQEARITGRATSLTFSTLSCRLSQTKEPASRRLPLSCTPPSVRLDIQVPRYTGRSLTPAQAVTKECKVERKYGLESSVAITLFDPASFFSKSEADGDEQPPNLDAQDSVASGNGSSSSRSSSGSRGGGSKAGGIGTGAASTKELLMAEWLRRGVCVGGPGSDLRELREKLSAQLQRGGVQLALEFDRPNVRSSAAEAFRAVLDIAEAARGRRAARRTHSKEHRDPTLSRLLGRDGGSFAGGLRGEMKRLDAAGALEEVFAELIAARKSKGGE